MIRNCLIFCLCLLAGVAQAAATDEPQVSYRTFSAAVAVDAAGKINEVNLGKSVPSQLADVMNQAAALAEFEPALLNGVPAPSRTTLYVTFRMVGDGDRVRAEVDSLASGGGGLRSQPPRYPSAPLRAGVAAKAWVRVSFGADGKLDAAQSSVESLVLARGGKPIGGGDHSRYEGAFRRSVETTMVNWVFIPDEVAGHPVPASVWVPVTFCPPPVRNCDSSWVEDPGQRPTALAALDKAVRLAVIKPYSAPQDER